MNKEQYFEEFKKEIAENPVLLYAKGTKDQPRCGFSATVIQILNSYGIPFQVVNILADFDKKEYLKEFSQWPTIPQLYVNGELVGGCDIAKEMHESGELKDLLQKAAK